MKHEKIILRKDQTQVRISVRLIIDIFENSFKYAVDTYTMGKQQLTWNYDSNSIAASENEIEGAKLELWQKLKP